MMHGQANIKFPSELLVVRVCSFHQLLAWKLGDIKRKKLVFLTLNSSTRPFVL